MRFKLYFDLENERLPIQYHRCIISFIKHSLLQHSEEYYQSLYGNKDNIIKPYTFAVFFNEPIFQKEEILIKDKKFELNFSIADYNLAVILYNSFNYQKKKLFSLNRNSMTLSNISLIPEKDITQDAICIKFLSPLVVRDRNQETKKDFYHSFKSEKFKETLKINIKEQLKITNINTKYIDTFDIEAIDAKKTVVKFYEKQIECSLGIFKLTGEKELLKFLYQSGMGSKRSAGFGMFSII